MQPTVKSELPDEMTVPSEANSIVNQSDVDMVTVIETLTSDSITKRSRQDVDMEDPKAETSTPKTSNTTTTTSTRVTRSSKRLKVDTEIVEGSMLEDTDQAKFVMDLFAIRTGSNGERSHFLCT